MSVAGAVDISLDAMGGLVLDMAPSDLPDGVSPDCQDVAFKPGAVFTRPGLASLFAAIAGNPTINYLKTFTEPNLTELLLALDSSGSLWSAQTNVLTLISAANVPGSRGKSATIFGREYLALGDGKFGLDIPRQYDGSNYDRVSQVGPGAPPAVADTAGPAVNIVASANGLIPLTSAISGIKSYPTGLLIVKVGLIPPALQVGDKLKITGTVDFNAEWTVSGVNVLGGIALGYTTPNIDDGPGGTVQYNLTTLTTTVANTLVAGGTGTIAGAGVAGYVGTWNVRSVTSTTVSILYITGADALANSGGGTVAGGGSISAGLHLACVLFVTRQGAILKPSPTTSWTAAGNQGATVSVIPIGPVNIKQRILAFSVAGGANLFYLPSFIINDNTTTSLTVNFTDAALAAGTQINLAGQNLFNQVELGECVGSIAYANRVLWWGERNKINNFQNLSFDGGWSLGGGFGGSDVHLGWLSTVVAGGSKDSVNVVWGDGYRITGDGATATRGTITQSAYQDWLGVRILQDQVNYSARVRAMKGGGITQGVLTIDLYSPAAGVLGTFVVAVANISSTSLTESLGGFLAGQNIPADAALRVYVSGTPTNNGWIVIDNIEIFPTFAPYNHTQLRASSIFGIFGQLPEGFDGISGLLQLNHNAQRVTSAFVLTDRSSLVANDHLHIVKEGSIFRTQDNGGSPSTWPITQVSGAIVGRHAVPACCDAKKCSPRSG